MRQKLIIILSLLISFHVHADRYGIYDDEYSSSGDNILFIPIIIIILGYFIFIYTVKFLIKLLNCIQIILKKFQYHSKCNILKSEIKSNIKSLISKEIKVINKKPKHIKMCYLLPASAIYLILLVNGMYTNELMLSIVLLIFFSLMIGVVLQFFYLSFLHLKSYFIVSKKYKQFKTLPNNYDELIAIKNIVDSLS